MIYFDAASVAAASAAVFWPRRRSAVVLKTVYPRCFVFFPSQRFKKHACKKNNHGTAAAALGLRSVVWRNRPLSFHSFCLSSRPRRL